MGDLTYLKLGKSKIPWFQFTTEEKNRIMDAFRSHKKTRYYDPQTILGFILSLQMLCLQEIYLRSRKNPRDQRDKLKTTIRRLKDSEGELAAILGGVHPLPERTFEDMTVKKWNDFTTIQDSCEKALLEIVKVRECCEQALKLQLRGKGRSRADETGLTKSVSILYGKLFDKPSSTKEGTFWTVMDVIRETLGHKKSSPRRAIEGIRNKGMDAKIR